MREIKFVGYTVTAEGIKPLAERVDAIVKVPLPATIGDLRRYLGMINFYRRFIPAAAKILQPLNDLLKGTKKCNASTEWSEQTRKSCWNVQNVSRPVRTHTLRDYRNGIFARLSILSNVYRSFFALARSRSHC